ncbi:uncharacterized protein LOC135150406 [Daucus carota subsp. sativus]|uniref:uncharacterized protein LOC135150406 n=1 Tax=Daucus carota subsp. sativus TaxID=79200 RepID=UPI003082BEC8
MVTSAFTYAGVEFVPNNHAAILDTTDVPGDYHVIQEFLAQSALARALTAPARLSGNLISKDEKRPVLRPLQIPAPLRARLNLPPAPQQQPQNQPQHPVSPTATRQPRSSTPKPSRATKSDAAPSTVKTRTSVATQASPQSRKVRFKARANKPKKAKVPITEITDFTLEEEQAPSTSLPDLSQALMVHPLQAVPLSTATASSTSSEVDEEIVCKEPEAGTTLSDPQTPISDRGPSTPIPHSPLKFPEALEALQSLAKAGEEPSKSKSDSAKSVPDPVKSAVDPASDDDEDDETEDDENEDEVPMSLQQQKWESTSEYNARLQTLKPNSEPLPRDLQVDPPNEPKSYSSISEDISYCSCSNI